MMSRSGHKSPAAQKPAADNLPRLAADPNLAYCARLKDEADKVAATRNLDKSQGRVSRLRDLSVESLAADAKLQWDASIETNYVPSKWLLEQELKARKRWDAATGSLLDEPCFRHDGEETRDVYEIAA